MTSSLQGLPALDTHAHIDPTVTTRQVAALGESHTFAVTRSLDEAEQVPRWGQDRLTWAVGIHPGVKAAQQQYDPARFAALLPRFGVVGEIGLDKRAGNLPGQVATLNSILEIVTDEPVLLSIHSTGASTMLLDTLEKRPHPGAILHWWTDNGPELDRAVASGAYFSINSAVRLDILARLPADRILPETDFPARQVEAKRPGNTQSIEVLLGEHWDLDVQKTKHRLWVNLRRLASQAGALDRLSEPLADLLETV